VGVAVIDSGIDFSHPDLNVRPESFSVFPPDAGDRNGHGTHMAGIIGAKALNRVGIRGVAPGAALYAVPALDASRRGGLDGLIAGIDWVTEHAAALNIKVANVSLGADGWSAPDCGMSMFDGFIYDPLHWAICRSTQAGITYIAAAGNGGNDVATFVPAA